MPRVLLHIQGLTSQDGLQTLQVYDQAMLLLRAAGRATKAVQGRTCSESTQPLLTVALPSASPAAALARQLRDCATRGGHDRLCRTGWQAQS